MDAPASSGMDPQALAEACAAAMWAEDRASQDLGMAIERVAPGEAVLAMTVTERMVNGHGLCHGGFIFTLADSAFAFACNTYDQVTVAAAAQVVFARPARLGDELAAEADAERRHVERERLAENVLLLPEPGMEVLLVRVHDAPEHDHAVVVAQRARWRADHRAVVVELVPALGDDVPEHLRRVAVLVAKGEDSHPPDSTERAPPRAAQPGGHAPPAPAGRRRRSRRRSRRRA